MADIFISYSSHDREKALSLANELRSEGASVWIDQAIDGAAKWSEEIAQALDECKALILLVSKSSLSSKNCAKEVTIAAESDKHILPIDLEDIPLPREFKYHLAGIQRVAFSNRDAIRRSIHNLISPNLVQSRQGVSRQVHENLIRLAVLPFDDLSPKKDNAWFADGMMDELIGTLSQVQKLRVASRSEVIYYRKHRPKAKKIADDLKVRYLIGGSIRKAGEKIRITVSLSDMAFGEQLWMNNYDGTFDDVFDFQETVSKKIAEALELKLSPQEEKAMKEQPTENTEAYELYLRAQSSGYLATRAGYSQAIKFFEDAIHLDPNFVSAHLELANTCSSYYRECSRNPIWLERAEEHLLIGEKLKGETAQTLWIRGEIAWLRNKFEDAEIALKKACVLDPKFPRPFNILGNMYFSVGKYQEASEEFIAVLDIVENTTTYYNVLVALSVIKDTKRLKLIAEKAITTFENHILRRPEDSNTKVCFAFVLFWSDRITEATDQANSISLSEKLDGVQMYNLGVLYNHLGQNDQYLELMRLSIKRGFRQIESIRDAINDTPNLEIPLTEILHDLESLIAIEGNE